MVFDLPSAALVGLTMESMLAWMSSGSMSRSFEGPSCCDSSSASSVPGASRSQADCGLPFRWRSSHAC